MSLPERFDCAETFQRLNDYLDRELSAEEIGLVEEHLAVCAMCAGEFHFEERLLLKLKLKAQESTMPDDVKTRVLQALYQAKEE